MVIKVSIIRAACLSVGVISLSGCDWVGMFAKEAVIGATSHRGWDTFTFAGQLPANFGIDAIAYYGPDNPSAINCQGPTLKMGTAVTRGYIKKYTADIQGQPQAFSFEIPLSYYKGLCGMKLGRVRLEIIARYGEQKWQRTDSVGNLWIESDGTSTFTEAGTLDVAVRCRFMFQESHLHFGIDKIMACKSKGASLPRAELANKTVSLNVGADAEENPAEDETWIRFSSGWKPCAEKNGWRWCREPVEFKTFKMNGQTCTVYPNCTE